MNKDLALRVFKSEIHKLESKIKETKKQFQSFDSIDVSIFIDDLKEIQLDLEKLLEGMN